MKKFLILKILFYSSLTLYSQNAKVDSLLNLLKVAKEDTTKVNLLCLLSDESSDATDILNYSQKALSLAEKLNYDKGRAHALTNIGTAEAEQGNFSKALEYYERSLKICEKTGDENRMTEIFNSEGTIYEITGDVSKALKYYFKSLVLNEKIGNEDGIALSHSNIGRNYVRQGNPLQAIEYYNNSLRIREKLGNKENLALALSDLAVIYQDQGNLSKALEYSFRSLKIREEIGDDGGLAESLNNIGYIHFSQNDVQQALEYYKKSLKIQEKLGNKYGIAQSLSNIGSVYLRQENYSEAFKLLSQCLTIQEKIGDKTGVALSLNNIASVYQKQNKLDLSLEYFQRSYKYYEELGDKNGLIKTLKNIGSTFFLKKDFKKAEEYCERALNSAREIGSPEKLSTVSQELSKIYAEDGKYKDAYEMHVLFKQMSDSMNNVETRKSTVKKQMNYEFEKKEALTKAETDKKAVLASAEIKRQKLIRNSTFGGVGIAGIFSFLLIRSYNRRKKTTFEKQVSEVEMKALRSQMNPHFIFNALQSVNDFILKKDTVNASNFTIKFSKLMRSVLENSIHREVPLEKDISTLELYMQLESSRLEHPFEYEITVDPKIDPEATLIPPLILQPFVENSIWHGLKHKKEKGKIKIEIKEQNDSIVCCIEDNGVGREKANALKEPVAGKRESLGMKLTKERLKILEQVKNFRSRIEIVDLKDAMNNPLGLRVELLLPLVTLN